MCFYSIKCYNYKQYVSGEYEYDHNMCFTFYTLLPDSHIYIRVTNHRHQQATKQMTYCSLSLFRSGSRINSFLTMIKYYYGGP